MALMRWDPFSELNALHDQLNNLFNDTFSHSQSVRLAPVTDVYSEDGTQMVVEVHLPNFTQDEVDLAVHDNAIEIKAQHHEKNEDKQKRQYLVRESTSSFYRRVALPKQAHEDGITANFDNGVLKITVPLKELPQPKRVEIAGKSRKQGKKEK